MSEIIPVQDTNFEHSTSTVGSKRAVERLVAMQQTIAAEIRSLCAVHSRFIAAVTANGASTQHAVMSNYRDQLDTILTLLAKSRLMLDDFVDEGNSQFGSSRSIAL